LNHFPFDTIFPLERRGAGPTGRKATLTAEFHISAAVRARCGFGDALFASSGNVIFANLKAVRLFVQKYNATLDCAAPAERFLKAGQVNAMGLIDEIFHYVCHQYRTQVNPGFFSGALASLEARFGAEGVTNVLLEFTREFPPMAVYRDGMKPEAWLAASDPLGTPNRAVSLEELALLILANENPAFEPFFPLFSDKKLKTLPLYGKCAAALREWSAGQPPFGPEGKDLLGMLKAPVEYAPYDLKGQLEYIRTRWGALLGDWLARLLAGLDAMAEEEKAGWAGGIGSGTPDMDAYQFGDISKEYERFSPDRDWMPNVVLMAKTVLVWLHQLSVKYRREITRLDHIPDEELDSLAAAGFTGLWLIGLWERSPASARIKQICGNAEAAASAYSLDDYEIANELGGWAALESLRARAWKRGIRMASDMVPNHTGMDSKWVTERPDLFVQTRECPFPGYDFNGENLSRDGRIGIYLENHYYSKSDCAVVFKRVDHATGETRYIYHGNDGTGMPWNDTAQIDFLNPEAREEVIQKILHVARNFPIIRFDAAMVLAKKHIQRLWYPEPGKGGDIASRSQFSLTRDEFERRIPEEFWREVVDRCAREIPDTLLLAEAFWMMEGYFVRTLGMHRVYNSAFMNMLKREDNDKYRATIKNTIEFDPEILKRYVNFMNNPDEETAVAQFGKGDKYFGVCTMMVAMPGLPMFGHGQIEGFEEKYGMEYRRAYRDEVPDGELVERHRREIFPLMKRRWLFAGVENFLLYDFWENDRVNENVFVWSNRAGNERALIFYNNVYQRATGWVKQSASYAVKQNDGAKTLTSRNLGEGLALINRDDRYCVMQEMRSGLWYVRTTSELCERGIFAALDGFQTQVFVNIYEVDDTDDRRYGALYHALGGRGIADVRMGIQNIVLRELYAALAAVFDRSVLDYVSGTTETLPADFSDTVAELLKTADAFLDKADENGPIPLYAKRATDTAALCASLEDRLSRIASSELPVELGLARDTDARGAFAYAAVMLTLAEYADPLRSDESLADLTERWSLDKKAAELFTALEIESGIATRILETALVVTPLIGGKPLPKAGRAKALLLRILGADKARKAIGVHEWDGVEWYNKEAAEFVLDTALCSIAYGLWTGYGSQAPSDARKVRKEAFGLIAESLFRVENLGELCGKGPNKKAGTVSAPAGKTARTKASAPAAKASATAAAKKKGEKDAPMPRKKQAPKK